MDLDAIDRFAKTFPSLVANRIPELTRRIREQDAEIARLRRFVTDQGKTCYSCEVCGHARTTRECLRCEVKELRALCGKAADRIRSFVVADEVDHPEKLPDEAAVELCYHLRAASKGREQ